VVFGLHVRRVDVPILYRRHGRAFLDLRVFNLVDTHVHVLLVTVTPVQLLLNEEVLHLLRCDQLWPLVVELLTVVVPTHHLGRNALARMLADVHRCILDPFRQCFDRTVRHLVGSLHKHVPINHFDLILVVCVRFNALVFSPIAQATEFLATGALNNMLSIVAVYQLLLPHRLGLQLLRVLRYPKVLLGIFEGASLLH
jgi:hypothetical protein